MSRLLLGGGIKAGRAYKMFLDCGLYVTELLEKAEIRCIKVTSDLEKAEGNVKKWLEDGEINER